MNFEEILAKMKPEHAQVIQEELAKAKNEIPEATSVELNKVKQDLTAAQDEAVKAKGEAKCAQEKLDAIEKAKPQEPNLEDVIKGLDPAVQNIVKALKTAADDATAKQKAAEDVVKGLHEAKLNEEAIAKAKELKALPVEEAKLVAVVKSATPEVMEILKAVSTAIETGTLLTEIGKYKGGNDGHDAWEKIEKKADEIVVAEKITKQKAIAKVIKENPEMYKEYLKGGIN